MEWLAGPVARTVTWTSANKYIEFLISWFWLICQWGVVLDHFPPSCLLFPSRPLLTSLFVPPGTWPSPCRLFQSQCSSLTCLQPCHATTPGMGWWVELSRLTRNKTASRYPFPHSSLYNLSLSHQLLISLQTPFSWIVYSFCVFRGREVLKANTLLHNITQPLSCWCRVDFCHHCETGCHGSQVPGIKGGGSPWVIPCWSATVAGPSTGSGAPVECWC